jgi:hypothetical protein
MGVATTLGGRTSYLVTPAEIDFVVRFALKLNAKVESAVENTRRSGVPVFYVPPTEMAFQPRHTACDLGKHGDVTEPFARSVIGPNGLNGAGVTRETIADYLLGRGGQIKGRFKAEFTPVFNSLQEVAHPNVAGYDAETLAILRWSRSRAADQAVEFTKKAKAADPPDLTWDSSEVNLGQLEPGKTPTLQGGTTYPLTADGFAPGTELRVVTHSEPRLLSVVRADSQGRVSTQVSIPRDLDDGRHTLEVTGVDPQGQPRSIRTPFAIDRPFRPTVEQSVAVASAVAALLGLLLLWLSGGLAEWRRRLRGTRDAHAASAPAT